MTAGGAQPATLSPPRSAALLPTGASADSPATAGLTEAEATRRFAERGRAARPRTSRSYASIVRANVFTVFNLILRVFGVADAGVRRVAGRALPRHPRRERGDRDRRRRCARSGRSTGSRRSSRRGRRSCATASRAQVASRRWSPATSCASARATRSWPTGRSRSDGLRLDESILTGESRPSRAAPASEVRSGSFAVEGSGAYAVTAVGADSYAERLAGEAREFRHPRSPLERALNRLLLVLVARDGARSGSLLGYALWHGTRRSARPWRRRWPRSSRSSPRA